MLALVQGSRFPCVWASDLARRAITADEVSAQGPFGFIRST